LFQKVVPDCNLQRRPGEGDRQLSDEYASLPAVLLAANGWDHDHWRAFYADDLPEEWRLGYYANVFPAVLIPTAGLSPTRDFCPWRDDVHERFLFYLEGGLDAGIARRAQAQLGKHLGGFIVGADHSGGEALPGNNLLCCDDLPALMANGACRGLRIPAEGPFVLADIRQAVEVLAARAVSGPPALLLVDGQPPDYVRLDQCHSLLELMGIA
jgi:hypothetical protein